MNLKQWLKSLIIIIFVALATTSFALQKDVREFDEKNIEEYRNNPEFDYTQKYSQSGSGFSLFLAYILSLISDFFDNPSVEEAIPLVLRVLLVLGIILALVLIVRLRFSNTFGRRSTDLGYPVHGFSSGVKEDYHNMYQESMANKDFKMAARYLFLHTLSVLEGRHNVKVTKWKAPNDYINEIPQDIKPSLQYVVNLFENSWYGDYAPDDEDLNSGYQHLQILNNA